MSNNNLGYQAFKFEWVGLTPRLITPVVIYPELEINQIRLNDILTNPASAKLVFYALWDTGAEISCIKPEAVKRLGISETNFVGFTQVTGVNSETQKMPRYKVGGLILPNNVMFEGFDLVESSIASEEADILIGMNLILQGDFSISNYGNKTVFCFSYPPHEKTIDLVEKSNSANSRLVKKIKRQNTFKH